MMLAELKEFLQIARNVRMTEMAVEKKEGNRILLRGRDKNASIVIYHEVHMDDVPAYLMGINKLDVFLDRLSLFDISNAKVTWKANNTTAKSVMLTSGRKSVSFTFTDPDNISPKFVSDDEIVSVVPLKKNSTVFEALRAMNSDEFMLCASENGSITVKLSDGGADKYEEDIEGATNLATCVWEQKWEAASIMLLLREALKTSDHVELFVGARGLLFVEVGKLKFTVLPYVGKGI